MYIWHENVNVIRNKKLLFENLNKNTIQWKKAFQSRLNRIFMSGSWLVSPSDFCFKTWLSWVSVIITVSTVCESICTCGCFALCVVCWSYSSPSACRYKCVFCSVPGSRWWVVWSRAADWLRFGPLEAAAGFGPRAAADGCSPPSHSAARRAAPRPRYRKFSAESAAGAPVTWDGKGDETKHEDHAKGWNKEEGLMRVEKEEGKGTWTRCEVWGRKNREHEQKERKENLHYKVNKREQKSVR